MLLRVSPPSSLALVVLLRHAPLACVLSSCEAGTPAPVVAAPAAGARRPAQEDAAEPLYLAAVSAAAGEPEAVLERIEAALLAGACPTRTLTESAFARLHTDPRFRELIRSHAHQSVTVMVLPEEPGERLFVSGTVRDAQGRPVAGALVHAYQTDAGGIYSPRGEDAPRLFCYARTDGDGRYGFRTIRPGHYPDEDEPVEAHIHLEITSPAGELTLSRLGFADDPFWRERTIPRWAVPVVRDADGILRCTFDVSLR